MYGLSDRAIDVLGHIYETHRIAEKHKITFQQFVEMKIRGDWDNLVA